MSGIISNAFADDCSKKATMTVSFSLVFENDAPRILLTVLRYHIFILLKQFHFTNFC